MKHSTERILTTHTVSLPRPDDLAAMMLAREEGLEPSGLAAVVVADGFTVVASSGEIDLPVPRPERAQLSNAFEVLIGMPE